jgi:transcription termination/antitermination protein NusA
VARSLSPAKTIKVNIRPDNKSAVIVVPDYQLSLAIGKEGQNVRLAAKLSGCKIDIVSESKYNEKNTPKNDEIAADDQEENIIDSGSEEVINTEEKTVSDETNETES